MSGPMTGPVTSTVDYASADGLGVIRLKPPGGAQRHRPGVIVTMRGRPVTVVGFTVAGGRIVEIDAIADAERVRRITAAALGDE